MKTTYVLYDKAGRGVEGIFESLHIALYYSLPGNQIVTLKGPYFGEGIHTTVRLVGEKKRCKFIKELQVGSYED